MNILLVAINAKNIHKSLAPWCLKAYVDEKSEDFKISVLETSMNDVIVNTIAKIYESNPNVIAFSCYIWNIELVKKIGVEIRKLIPNIKIVLGGPEVSFEKNTDNYPFCDTILCGEGEEIFFSLLMKIKTGDSLPQIISSNQMLDLNSLPSPYTNEFFESFTSETIPIEKQLIYFESSRGCPFSCGYCLSSVHNGVNYLSIENTKARLDRLISKGAKIIKFVDRTFNANRQHAFAILNLVKEYETDCLFHFEISADLVTDEFIAIISTMPIGRVQFEIGVQSTNTETLVALNRKTNTEKVLSIIERLSALKNCHIHIDLIAGLPFETYSIFKTSFNKALESKPHVLQLGFLKMLKGSAMRNQSDEFEYKYLDFAPYEVLENKFITFSELSLLKGIEKAVDKFYNTGMFEKSINYTVENVFKSDYFAFFEALAKYCKMINRDPKFSLKNSYTILYKFMKTYLSDDIASHYIKLDCLTCDSKGMLPDGIMSKRNRDVERDYWQESGTKNLRAEYFDYDDTMRVFFYDEKNAITNRYNTSDVPHL